jgi:lipoprotein signal peptidase
MARQELHMNIFRLIGMALLWAIASSAATELAFAQNAGAAAPAAAGWNWVWWLIAVAIIIAIVGFIFSRGRRRP